MLRTGCPRLAPSPLLPAPHFSPSLGMDTHGGLRGRRNSPEACFEFARGVLFPRAKAGGGASSGLGGESCTALCCKAPDVAACIVGTRHGCGPCQLRCVPLGLHEQAAVNMLGKKAETVWNREGREAGTSRCKKRGKRKCCSQPVRPTLCGLVGLQRSHGSIPSQSHHSRVGNLCLHLRRWHKAGVPAEISWPTWVCMPARCRPAIRVHRRGAWMAVCSSIH